MIDVFATTHKIFKNKSSLQINIELTNEQFLGRFVPYMLRKKKKRKTNQNEDHYSRNRNMTRILTTTDLDAQCINLGCVTGLVTEGPGLVELATEGLDGLVTGGPVT